MNEPFPRPTSSRHRRLCGWLAAACALLALTLLDKSLWRWARLDPGEFERASGRDLYHLFRQAGYLPTWLVIGAAIAGAEWKRGLARRWSRGLSLGASALLSGVLAEIGKGVFMRQRPGESGEYWFTWMNDDWSRGPGHGLPSSHAAVAFGAAFALARLYPGSGPVAIAVATGCGITRMLAGAHFATDVFVAGVIGWLSARWICDLHRRWEFLAGG
ncbi:MAG: phosphatase PAP2 family protein [Phycisphaerales bacterium]